ncbi:hypothetical protein [Agreia sp. VKM Ac-1783]|uniref:hypothetical protein n=1 Tax=Agreia sp. VKM Ac-1783 TaxID=1938889 RepID=UPI000A2AB334|nr:hypothetical protein [Agreia sp. VKM Ac-1783]SMQ73495.1 hypothetical protein SAMN06295943_2896 [Agreia sp. VKM Ac-1783]
MSRHHRAQKWSTHSPKLRKIIQPQLPQKCIDCPHPVMPTDKWQVGHRNAAGTGGPPTLANVGPSHAWCPYCRKRCNQVAGGKLGARISNRNRNARRDIREW